MGNGDGDNARSNKVVCGKREKGKVLEDGGKRLYWDWEHRMRTNCTAKRPDLTLEDEEKKTVLLVPK